MTSAEPMTPKALLELASLDAVGLLDEFEARAYTHAFHDAPATVQDEVLRLQAKITEDLSLLPTDEPDPQLRERVLRAVAAAIEQADAPIARIGRWRRHERPGEKRYTSSLLFWRAASFVMAGAALIMAYFLAVGYQTSIELWRATRWDDLTRLEVLLEPASKQFLLDQSRKIDLEPVSPGSAYAGALYVNETTGQVLVVVDNLPKTKEREYFLQVVLKDGGTTRLDAFDSLGGFGGTLVENVPASLISGAFKWEIATLGGEVLLRSA